MDENETAGWFLRNLFAGINLLISALVMCRFANFCTFVLACGETKHCVSLGHCSTIVALGLGCSYDKKWYSPWTKIRIPRGNSNHTTFCQCGLLRCEESVVCTEFQRMLIEPARMPLSAFKYLINTIS